MEVCHLNTYCQFQLNVMNKRLHEKAQVHVKKAITEIMSDSIPCITSPHKPNFPSLDIDEMVKKEVFIINYLSSDANVTLRSLKLDRVVVREVHVIHVGVVHHRLQNPQSLRFLVNDYAAGKFKMKVPIRYG